MKPEKAIYDELISLRVCGTIDGSGASAFSWLREISQDAYPDSVGDAAVRALLRLSVKQLTVADDEAAAITDLWNLGVVRRKYEDRKRQARQHTDITENSLPKAMRPWTKQLAVAVLQIHNARDRSVSKAATAPVRFSMADSRLGTSKSDVQTIYLTAHLTEQIALADVVITEVEQANGLYFQPSFRGNAGPCSDEQLAAMHLARRRALFAQHSSFMSTLLAYPKLDCVQSDTALRLNADRYAETALEFGPFSEALGPAAVAQFGNDQEPDRQAETALFRRWDRWLSQHNQFEGRHSPMNGLAFTAACIHVELQRFVPSRLVERAYESYVDKIVTGLISRAVPVGLWDEVWNGLIWARAQAACWPDRNLEDFLDDPAGSDDILLDGSGPLAGVRHSIFRSTAPISRN